MNSIFIISNGFYGGTGKVTKEYYEYLKERGYKVKVIGDFKEEDIQVEEDIIKLIPRNENASKLIYHIFNILYLNYLKIKYKPKLSYSIGDYYNTLNALTFYGKKIGSIHGLKSEVLKNGKKTSKVLTILLMKIWIIFLDEIICISQGMKKDLEITFKIKKKLKVIYNPFNIKKIKKLSNESIEKKFQEKEYIIFVGALTEQKKIKFLIENFNKISKVKKNINFLILGKGKKEFEEILKEKTQKLGLENKIYFLGEKKNPYKYIKNSKYLMMASSHEAFPNVIIESLILETPILTTCSTPSFFDILDNTSIEKIPIYFKGGIIVPCIKDRLSENIYFDYSLKLLMESDMYLALKKEIKKLDILKKFEANNVMEVFLEHYDN